MKKVFLTGFLVLGFLVGFLTISYVLDTENYMNHFAVMTATTGTITTLTSTTGNITTLNTTTGNITTLNTTTGNIAEVVTDSMTHLTSAVIYTGSALITDGGDVTINASNTGANLNIRTYDNGTTFSTLELFHSLDDTIGTYTETIDGRALGSINFDGVDSSSSKDIGAYIKATQVGASGARVPARIAISACTSTTVEDEMFIVHGPDKAIYIRPDGDNVRVSTFGSTGNLNIPGDLTTAGEILRSSQPVMSANVYMNGSSTTLVNVAGTYTILCSTWAESATTAWHRIGLSDNGNLSRAYYVGKKTHKIQYITSISVAGSAATNISVIYYKNGAAVGMPAIITIAPAGTAVVNCTLVKVLEMATDDYIEVWGTTDDADNILVYTSMMEGVCAD